VEERFGVKGMLSDDDCEGRVFKRWEVPVYI